MDILKERHNTFIFQCHYFLTPARMATINKSTNNKCRLRCSEKRTLVHCWWECRLLQPLWKTVWNSLRKLKIELPFDSAIPLLGIHPKNPETPVRKNISTPMFIAALFTIAKVWKQPKCPLVDEKIKKMWNISPVEYYVAVEKKELLTLHNSMNEPGEHHDK